MDKKKKALSVKLNIEDYKKLILLCKIENDISHQDFAENSILYCIEKKILPAPKKMK